ncbi:phosphodiester glycosidase family protein [Cypionkella psychrotolerans]|uniref:phosphodiester glycosidase family protein n=1 Tax=Cypionkella psychrotolerans TaxID=1678131 RepID=UPI0006B5EEBB|nr:phosphodiester glycosidase family protein [Cypionkella psychrotolerans]
MWRLAFMLAVWGMGAFAGCRDMAFEGASYSICEVSAGADLRLFHSGPDGALGSFSALDKMLEPRGLRLDFAMNAGMYHRDLSPVGLYIEDGAQATPLITRAGPGNFGLVPNGVFCIGATLRVIETLAFAAEKPSCRYATQSGPMLVIGGKLHPKFLADSDSLNIRNGVGVSADGSRAVFAISNDQVNFYTFARLFRDGLGLPDALYFDGSISRLYDHDSGRHDAGFPMGPMVGVVVPR